MKSLIFIACLLASTACFAQHDYCKDIKKERGATKDYVKYKSPTKFGSPNIFITKTITGGKSILQIAFMVESDKPKNAASGLVVKFSDGQELKLPGLKVGVSNNGWPTGYSYTATLDVDASNIASFTGKTIAGYTIATIDETVISSWGEKFKSWLTCMDNIK